MFISKQVKKATREAKAAPSTDGNRAVFEVRDRLVKIAALAVSGIESIDRVHL